MSKPAILLTTAIFLLGSQFASAQATSGEAVYKERCAACHDSANPRIPPKASLQALPSTRILRTLNYGAMIAVAYTMSTSERESVAKYLGTASGDPAPAPVAYCKDRTVKLSANPKIQWNGWSPDALNWRYQNTAAAGLSVDQAKRLKLKWAFGFEGDLTAFSQPTILDDQLFVGSAGGLIHALDRESGCIRWVYQADGPVRSSLLAVRDGARYLLLFGDQVGGFYALEAATGKPAWKKRVETHDAARLTGTPITVDGNVIIPVAGWEENRASDPKYACCSMRGSVLALKVHDGTQVWKTYMTDEAKQTGTKANGTAMMGPSGAGIWSAPTLDRERGMLYVTTGDNYSKPATELSDAVVALDIKTGKIKWHKQFTADDTFSGACAGTAECGPDFDFGSSAMLVKQAGRSVLIAGQKSGIVYGLDPDREGNVLWELRVGKGSTNGGVLWGMATDGQNAYTAVSDIGRVAHKKTDLAELRDRDVDPNVGGGITAIRVSDGSKKWFTPGQPCNPPKPGCSPAQPAAVTAIPGMVFSGSVDGHLRTYASEDGKIIWDFDTAQEFTTVNGVKGQGGSIDGPGPVVVKGMVYVNSGYSRQAGMPGNVLLAFGVE